MSSAVVSEMLIRIAADTAQLRSEMDQAKRAVGNSFSGIESMANSLRNTLLGIFAGIGVAKLAEEFVKTADAMQSLDARLKNATGSSEAYAEAQREIYRIAQQNNIGIQEATTLFTKLHEPVKRLGGTVHETSGIVEAFSLSMRLGGATTAEAASATLQFGQAMGSGKLQGDEFRAMAEASPRFMKALAEGMNTPIEKLKQMGSDGKLTADVVGNALIKSLGDLKKEAGDMPDTVSGAFQRMKNDIILTVDELNKNSGLTLGLAGMLEVLRNDVLPAVKVELGAAFEAVGGWIDKNKEGLIKVWEAIKAAMAESWELVKAVAAGLKPLADWVVQSGALRIVFESVRLIIAGIIDGVNLIAAGIKYIAGDTEGAKKMFDAFRNGESAVQKLNAELAANKEVTAEVAKESAEAASASTTNTEAFKKLKNAHAELTKEQKDALEHYKKLINSIHEKTGAVLAETEQGEKLTAGQKTALKVMQDIQNGTLKLTTAQKQAVTIALEQLLAAERVNENHKAQARLLEELRKQREEDAKAAIKEAEAVQKELDTQQQANDQLRYTKQQLGEVEVARIHDRIAMMETVVQQEEMIGVCTRETEAHKDTLQALKDLKTAREEGIYLEAAKDAAEEWKKTAATIEQSLTDALLKGFDSGKGFMQSLKDYIVNAFKTTAVKLLVQPIMAGMGLSAAGSAAASTGSSVGGISSLFSTASNIYQGGMNFLNGSMITNGATDFVSQLGTHIGGNTGANLMMNSELYGSYLGMAGNGLAGYGLGSFANSAISGQYSVGGGFNTVANIGAAVAGALAGPIGGAVVGAVAGLINRAFGMGPQEVQASGITGSITGGSTTGQTFAQWHQDGGWFRNDRNGTNYGSMTSDMSNALNAGASAIYQQTRAWAAALKLPADTLARVTHDFRVTLTDDAAQNQQAITQLMTDYQSDLLEPFRYFLMQLHHDGETLAETFQRLAVIQTFSNSIEGLGGIFTRIARSSYDARTSLIEMAGGLDNLVGQINQFVADYYTEAERAGLTAKQIADALRAVGIDPNNLMTREDYRALVESRNVDTEQGRQQLAALLALGPQFAQLSDYLTTNALDVGDAVRNAPSTALLGQMVDPAQTTATAVTSMAASVDQSNSLLTTISNKLSSIADTSTSAKDAALAAVQAAQSAVRAAQEAVSAASLVTSAPSYSYNIGGR